jgi:hypothetical protein
VNTAALILLVLLACGCILLTALIRSRNAHIWLPAYVRSRRARRARTAARATADIVHVIFAFVDHFEPVVKPDQDPATKADAMESLVAQYPELAGRHTDSDARPPRRTWTYPVEAAREDHLEQLVGLCRRGLGEVEVHIHHDGDTADTFRERMQQGLDLFGRFGVCRVPGADGPRFAFVHGNWALDNSHPEGKWCGVNNELQVLRELGCFVDVTFPSAPSATQPRMINSIYYATDNPARPRSHDVGVPTEVGRRPQGDLMLIQGPLLPDWSSRKLGLLPRIDNAAITGVYPGSPGRIDGWVRLGIGVIGRPDWVFVKVHGHGASASDRDALLGSGADAMFTHLERAYGAGEYRLHYVTAREMYNIVRAAEAGKTGDPGAWRDFEIPPYECSTAGPPA